jgi:mitogen-activated protein kinase kinase
MTASSTPLGLVNAARRPVARPLASTGSSDLSQDIQAKMKAFSLSRQGAPNSGGPTPPHGALAGVRGPNVLPNSPAVGGLLPPGIKSPPPRPSKVNWPGGSPVLAGQANPVTPKMPGGLAAKRGINRGMKLADAVSPGAGLPEPQKSPSNPIDGPPGAARPSQPSHNDSAFSKYSDMIDTKTGTLHFENKAIIHGGGIDFTSGRSFSISLDDVETLEELGQGNYGTVYKVRHCKPRLRRPGLGLRGALVSRESVSQHDYQPEKQQQQQQQQATPDHSSSDKAALSNVVMAMKEIRLELDDAKFAAIIMELDILHRCVSPFIIDFYGAFFQEGAVYMCVEYMDGGSMEKLYDGGVPEHILRKIALSTVMGLRTLKDQHNIIHRDVKPTNILANTRGQIKICDFGVSGNLVASIAKTNIGCQSYMAPERISGGHSGPAGTYSVQSDVWSLGLTLVECAIGRYPYPPDTYSNIFSQLNVSNPHPLLVLLVSTVTNRQRSLRPLSTAMHRDFPKKASPKMPETSSTVV